MDQPPDRARQLDDRDLVRAADVDDLAVGLFFHHGGVDARNGIAHERKAACLQAVTMHRNLRAAQRSLNEHRWRAAPPAQMLVRTIGAEEAQAA